MKLLYVSWARSPYAAFYAALRKSLQKDRQGHSIVLLSPSRTDGNPMQEEVVAMNAIMERCPWCDSVIARAKFLEIEAKIREQEQKRLADAEVQMRKRLEEKFQQDLAKEKQALERSAQEQAAKQVATVTAERDQVAAKLRVAEAREPAIRKQVEDEAAKQVAAALAQKDQMAEKVRQAEAREAAVRNQVQEEAAQQLATVAAERDQVSAKLKLAEASENAVRTQARQEAERTVKLRLEEADRLRQKELADQRLILTKDRDQAVIKERAAFGRERESWDKKFKDLDRQLQRKTAQEIGDGAEIDLFEDLRATFPGDKITRIQKGQAGADILHEVLYKGESCGRIVIDSKNRQAWQNAFVTKLRQDQTEAAAEHAILSTTVFPSGKKELCIESDAIVVNPARVCHIVSLLRRTMITVHVRGLSIKERASKMSRLYKEITSDAYAQRFGELRKMTNEILDLDVQEKKAHDAVWKKRGTVATRLNHLLREIDTEVAAIVEGRDTSDEVSAA